MNHPFQLQRHGVVMGPQPDNPMEAEGGVESGMGTRSRRPALSVSTTGGTRQLLADRHRAGDFQREWRSGGHREKLHCRFPQVVDILRENVWISYHSLVNEVCDTYHHLCHFDSHQRLAMPVKAWEQLEIGGGIPPILTKQGRLFLYHGVCEALSETDLEHKLSYSAGQLVLGEKRPHLFRYCLPEPVLTPELPKERIGIVPNVVFPTAIDRRDDLELPDRFDVYYGMADNYIGVARVDMPTLLHGPLSEKASIHARQTQTKVKSGG